MILIYTPKITTRLRYILDFILGDLLLLDFKLTSNKEEFEIYPDPKLSYANQPVADEIFFFTTPILFEKKIRKQSIEIFEYEEHKVFYKTNSKSALPFDPFAASFYLLSRYEEYLPHYKDSIDRFPAVESLAYKADFLQQPVIDQWALIIKKLILEKYPSFKFKKKKYHFTPTYDVDSAYAYRNKGLVRNLGGYLIALQNRNWTAIKERTRVLCNLKKDPFDTYEYQIELHKKYHLHSIYFFLVGDYDEYDKNISIRETEFQELIKSMADHGDVGIHPSFASNKDKEKLFKEIKDLALVLKRDIKKSRQHFLKLNIPNTYQRLIEYNITDDYSMGYATNIGFRASTSNSFYFYNLTHEIPTKLRVHPFAIMDATFQYYLKLSPEDAFSASQTIIDRVKKVNGHLMTLWHNNSLSKEQAPAWRSLYEKIIEKAAVH